MKAPEVEHHVIRSFDGTAIAYQARGSGPAIVLANGLGGTYSTWRHQYALFGDRYRVICWDYRGLFRSSRPARLETLALEEQVKDLDAILEAEGVDQALFIGWSMGVQFNFEYYRHRAERFAGLVVLNGTAGLPFQTAFQGSALVQAALPLFSGALKLAAPVIGKLTRVVAAWEGLVPLIQRIGMAAPTLDRDVFGDLAREYAELDFEAYAETFRRLGDHDASDLLHRVSLPTLIVTGSRDLFTPVATARAMAAAIPDAELVVIEGGTHYAAVEYPREMNEHIRDYMKKIKYGNIP
jgi:pimeloyl-ACP methyl ester carboxylesterase